jgi:outer membrane biogenesis lipoprotein LolB
MKPFLILNFTLSLAFCITVPVLAQPIKELPKPAVENDGGQTIFEVLASEIAVQRGEFALGYQTYLSLARKTRDPRLAQRAMEIALAAGAPDSALEAAESWDNLAGASPGNSKEVLVTLLMLNQRWADSVQPTVTLLRGQKPADREATIKRLMPLFAKAVNEDSALRAFYTIISALNPLPQDKDILFLYSMAADKTGHPEVMEKVLRMILIQNPNDVNALNALGYSLADRKEKLPEAFALITKAHQLSPDDAFILDSLGWVNFRLGNTVLAAQQLQQALQKKPEADIAAHLGEVQWRQQQVSAAEASWRQAEKLDANNATLRETLARLKPDWVSHNESKSAQWDGRFSVKVTGSVEGRNQGGSGGFTLTQNKLSDVLEIRNPIGGALAKITVTPGEAILERNGETFKAFDADTLLLNALGLALPARGLSDWMRAQARPGSSASVERNSDGLVTQIKQDGWTLNYDWINPNKLEKMIMIRNTNLGSVEVRLVFDYASN